MNWKIIFGIDEDSIRHRNFRILGEIHTAELHLAHLWEKLKTIDHTKDWNGYANCRQTIEEWQIELDRLKGKLK